MQKSSLSFKWLVAYFTLTTYLRLQSSRVLKNFTELWVYPVGTKNGPVKAWSWTGAKPLPKLMMTQYV